ncbi:hypothetical protein FRB99_005651 [Tulasnella sp. 403]|nr:hypothetical protein FRB99_005651 [Tulasnella sp. 403]
MRVSFLLVAAISTVALPLFAAPVPPVSGNKGLTKRFSTGTVYPTITYHNGEDSEEDDENEDDNVPAPRPAAANIVEAPQAGEEPTFWQETQDPEVWEMTILQAVNELTRIRGEAVRSDDDREFLRVWNQEFIAKISRIAGNHQMQLGWEGQSLEDISTSMIDFLGGEEEEEPESRPIDRFVEALTPMEKLEVRHIIEALHDALDTLHA